MTEVVVTYCSIYYWFITDQATNSNLNLKFEN